MRFRAMPVLVVYLLLISRCGFAQQQQLTEYQVKAAFIFNFAKLVEWPSNALPKPTSPIIIGVLGENPFHDDIEKTVRNKTVDDHPLQAKEFQSAAEATNCHILFISTSEASRLPQIFKTLEGASVLTVADMDHFTDNGGMINFFFDGTKIRLKFNNQVATRAGLKISSKLLNVGR